MFSKYFIRIIFYCIIFVFSLHSQNWTRGIGIPSTPVYSIVNHHDTLYASTDTVLYKSIDSGATWQTVASQPAITGTFNKFFSHQSYLYMGTMGDGIFCTRNGGITWQSMNDSFGESAKQIVDFAQSGDSLYVGTGDAGVFVLNLQNPSKLQPCNEGLFQVGVNSLTGNSNGVVAGIGEYVFVRRRNDSAWTDTQLDSTANQRTALKLNTFGNFVFAGTSVGVYRTDLNVMKWQKVGISLLPNLSVETFAIHGARIFAGVRFQFEHFICFSDNNGETWQIQFHEFAQLLDMTIVGNRLLAGRSDGMWYFDLGEVTTVEQSTTGFPHEYSLQQNFPNPFNPTTTISFSIPKTENVSLKVYDVTGKEVAVLVNDKREAGTYEASFNAGRLSSGIYFYRLIAGSFSSIKKMLVVK